MTVQEMLDEMDDHGFSDVAVTRKLQFLNRVYKSICARQKWPFLETELVNTVSAGTTAITIAADWRETLKLSVYSGSQTDITSLRPEQFEYLRDHFGDLESTSARGRPIYYYFEGNAISLYPIPDQTYSVIHEYLKRPASLVQADIETAILVPPDHHDVLVLGTLSKLYKMEDDSDLAADFKNDFNEALFFMTADVLIRQSDKPEHIYYTEPDEYLY